MAEITFKVATKEQVERLQAAINYCRNGLDVMELMCDGDNVMYDTKQIETDIANLEAYNKV